MTEVPASLTTPADPSASRDALRRRTWEVLEVATEGDRLSRTVDMALLTLIALNVAAVIVGTMAAVDARFGRALFAFEAVSVAVFTVEYVARLWSAPSDARYGDGAVRGRLRFARSPMALVDVAAVLPFFLPFLGVDLRMARALRLLRLFRLAKAGRYLRAIQLFGAVVREKREEMVLTTCVVALLLLFSASAMYFAEHRWQPEQFSSIPATMWWAVATLTTVGYGDVYPITALGKVLGAIVAVLGIGLFALPTAILGSGFVEEVSRARVPSRCPHCGGLAE